MIGCERHELSRAALRSERAARNNDQRLKVMIVISGAIRAGASGGIEGWHEALPTLAAMGLDGLGWNE
jgi:hypothetical protein